jgi:hypothetical protein
MYSCGVHVLIKCVSSEFPYLVGLHISLFRIKLLLLQTSGFVARRILKMHTFFHLTCTFSLIICFSKRKTKFRIIQFFD